MKENAYSKMIIVLIGNKVDLEENREVSYEQGQKFAQKNDLIFFETSAKTAFNVEKAFRTTTEQIVQNIDNNYYDLSNESIGIKPGNAMPAYMYQKQGSTAGGGKQNLKSNMGTNSEKKGCC